MRAMTLASPQRAASAGPGVVPRVVASYAVYLHARTRAVPEATVVGDRAGLVLAVGDTTLVLEFGCRGRDWSLRSAEVRSGEQTATFARGELAAAVTALLHPRAWRQGAARPNLGGGPERVAPPPNTARTGASPVQGGQPQQ